MADVGLLANEAKARAAGAKYGKYSVSKYVELGPCAIFAIDAIQRVTSTTLNLPLIRTSKL